MAGHFFTTIEDNVTGRPVVGATLKVYLAGATVSADHTSVTSGTLATIYSDDGVTTIDQSDTDQLPTSNSYGFVEFWTDEASFVLQVSYGGAAKWAIEDVELSTPGVPADLTALTARVDKHDTVFGLSASAIDLGTFTGTTISDNVSVVTALQELETALEGSALGGDLLSTNNLSDVTSASTARTNLGVGTAGTLGTAVASDLNTGTSTALANTPDALAGSIFGTKTVSLQVSDPNGDAISTGDGKAYWRVPSVCNGMDLIAVAAHVTTVSSSGNPSVAIYNVTDGVDMLSTNITIDANEKDSSTAATAAVINTATDDVATGDELRIDIDAAGTGAKGLIVELQFRLP